MVSNWFGANRGLALGLTSSGISLMICAAQFLYAYVSAASAALHLITYLIGIGQGCATTAESEGGSRSRFRDGGSSSCF